MVITIDQDIENRNIVTGIISREEYGSFNNAYANAIHNATQLFLSRHKSFESFVNALGNESFIQPFKGTNSYDMIVASAIDNIGNMMKHYPITVEDYSLNEVTSSLGLEGYVVSNEGIFGTTTAGIVSRLGNLGSTGWSKVKSWGEAISAGYKALKTAIAQKDWAVVRAIKSFITRVKNYAKDTTKKIEDFIGKKKGGKPFDPKNLSKNDRIRYDLAKSITDQATKKKDWDWLVDELNTRTQDFPDIIENIHKVLKSNGVKYKEINGRWELLK